jgi:hypothetical protein
LNWVDESTTEQGIKVERSVDGVTWSQIATLGANTTTYTASSLAPATAYSFRLRPYSGPVNGEFSDTATATTQGAPSAPTGLTAAALSTTQVRLNWTDTASNEQGFRIERSADGGASWASAGIAGENATTYTASSLAPATTYSFRVRAYSGTANGEYSGTATARTLDPPSAPTNLAGTPLGSTSLRLSWTNTAANQTYIKVERSSDGVSWTQIALISGSTTAYTNYSLTPATVYQYRLRGADSSTNGSYTAPVSVSTNPPAPAPGNVALTLVSNTSVKVNWSDTCSYESGFRIERSIDGETWTQVGQISANSTSFTNVLLASRTTYYYRVRAYDSTTNGEYSAVALITTP